jgi:ribA/ribD-fused uncharacterized protein
MTSNTSEPVYFWRPFEEHGYLGQWWNAPFSTPSPIDPAQKLTFKNCETYMMYHKALLFNDRVVALQILTSGSDPKTVKALGRKVKNFEQGKWDAAKFGIVVQANREKFAAHKGLREQLLATGERELVEASPMDRIWGVGFAKDRAGANRQWWGENLLGKALMQARKELKAEEDEKAAEKKAQEKKA